MQEVASGKKSCKKSPLLNNMFSVISACLQAQLSPAKVKIFVDNLIELLFGLHKHREAGLLAAG